MPTIKKTTGTDAVNAILADTVSRHENSVSKALKSMPENCTSSSSGTRIAKYEDSKNSRKPSSPRAKFNNSIEDRTDADNRLKEFMQGLRSTVIEGEEHWYDPKANRPYTLQEIADIMGVSRERVRQIEESGIKRMWRLLSAMNRRENLSPCDWLRIADDRNGENTDYNY